eukprot:scaffold244438_cov41-Prasinocladus_malaysianus.AAC.1
MASTVFQVSPQAWPRAVAVSITEPRRTRPLNDATRVQWALCFALCCFASNYLFTSPKVTKDLQWGQSCAEQPMAVACRRPPDGKAREARAACASYGAVLRSR